MSGIKLVTVVPYFIKLQLVDGSISDVTVRPCLHEGRVTLVEVTLANRSEKSKRLHEIR